MDEHTRIWSEPLSDSERCIIKALIADPARGDTGRWMSHLLKCYDALAVRAAELGRKPAFTLAEMQQVREAGRQAKARAEGLGRERKRIAADRDICLRRAERAEQERDEARAARDLLVEVNDELLGRIKRAEAALRASYPMTPVDCLISELRDGFFPVLGRTSVLTIAEFEKRVAQFKDEIARAALAPNLAVWAADARDVLWALSHKNLWDVSDRPVINALLARFDKLEERA